MHFEILVEGQTELTALSYLMSKIVGEYEKPHTWKIHKHRGIGKLPDNLTSSPNKKDRSLLHNLPSKLRAYGQNMQGSEVVVLLVDLDDKDCIVFKRELKSVLDCCNQKPNLLIRIAIEELEAWYLGDRKAIMTAFPSANQRVLNKYVQDSQVGTWEVLAEAVHPNGLSALNKLGKRSPLVLEQKKKWTKAIAPTMDVNNNESPSFCAFRDGIKSLANI